MQDENDTFRDFLRRTDALAVRLGIDVGELPEVLGFSRASLFAYRSGQRPITAKAWNKLALAEIRGGLRNEQAAEPVQLGDPLSIERRLERIEATLSRLVEAMGDQALDTPKTSSRGHGKKFGS